MNKVKAAISGILDDNYSFSIVNGQLEWLIKSDSSETKLVIRVDYFKNQERENFFQVIFKSPNRVRYYNASRTDRKLMLDQYITNYEQSLSEAGYSIKKLNRYKKFVLLSQRPKDEIYFQNIQQLEEWLLKLGPDIVANFKRLIK